MNHFYKFIDVIGVVQFQLEVNSEMPTADRNSLRRKITSLTSFESILINSRSEDTKYFSPLHYVHKYQKLILGGGTEETHVSSVSGGIWGAEFAAEVSNRLSQALGARGLVDPSRNPYQSITLGDQVYGTSSTPEEKEKEYIEKLKLAHEIYDLLTKYPCDKEENALSSGTTDQDQESN